jgi:hypothetical protein
MIMTGPYSPCRPHRLKVVPNLEFVVVPGQYGLHPFWLASQLWRLDPAHAFNTVLPNHDWPVPGGCITSRSARIGRAFTSSYFAKAVSRPRIVS